MRLREMPVTEGRGFVFVLAEVHALRDVVKMVSEAEIRWRRIDRIAPDDHHELDCTGFHITDKSLQGGHMIDRLCRSGLAVSDGVAHILQDMIHRVGQSMNTWRLVGPRDDETGAAMPLQVVRDGLQP
jgi:hypothetical protein